MAFLGFKSAHASRFLFLAGLTLIAVANTNPEWKTFGDGEAGLLEACGCRDINMNCRYQGRHNPDDPKESVFMNSGKCDQYITARAFAVITSIVAFFAAYILNLEEAPRVLPTRPGDMPLPGSEAAATAIEAATAAARVGTRPATPAGYRARWASLAPTKRWALGAMTLAMISGLITSAIFGDLIRTTGAHAEDLQWGYWIFTSGWLLTALFALGWGISDRWIWPGQETGWLHGITGLTIHFWSLTFLVLLVAGTASPHWAKPKIHEDYVTIPNFEKTINDTYANVGILNRTGTTFEALGANVVTPPTGDDPAFRKVNFGLWDICLCQDINAECKWSKTKLFGSTRCDAFYTAHIFAWFALGFGVLSYLPHGLTTYLANWKIGAVALTLSLLTSFITLVIMGVIWNEKNDAAGKIDGWAYISFGVGTGFLPSGYVTLSSMPGEMAHRRNHRPRANLVL